MQVITVIVHVIKSFWTPGLPEGVLSNRPCLWSVCWSIRWSVRWSIGPFVFEYLRDRPVVFQMKLGHHKGTKVTELDF